MKKGKTKFALYIAGGIVLAIGVITITNLAIAGVQKSIEFIENPLGDIEIPGVSVPKAKAGGYAYNDHVPAEVVRQEIIEQARQFGNDVEFMLNLADCESDFDNLAKNPGSTAKGVYQFIASTWDVTESGFKKVSPYSYKQNIREANIKIANLEYSHWEDCLD